MNIYIKIVFLVGFTVSSFAQITFNGCHGFFDNQNFTFTEIGTDATGRNIFETVPINEDQDCSGVGVCEFRISWNDVESRWEFIADDGTGDFSSTFLIYSNSEASTPNPPSLNLGTWVENTAVTESNCGGNLTTVNATLTGNVQDTTLGVNKLISESNSISLYPNPAKSTLNIKHKELNINQILVYNVLGKLVLQVKDVNSIDVSQCLSGLYFVEILTENKAFIKKLIIK